MSLIEHIERCFESSTRTFDGHAHYLVLPSPVAPALLSLLTLEDTKLKLCPGWTVEDKVACSFSNFAGLARASKTRDRFAGKQNQFHV